ncbi:MAG: hypothetical protein E6J91_14185 [Deltaproteobacteria bacterium]|nr:MAG: hypothetical protein E6J91_14185 [Deltaproteobacteria bacterium]
MIDDEVDIGDRACQIGRDDDSRREAAPAGRDRGEEREPEAERHDRPVGPIALVLLGDLVLDHRAAQRAGSGEQLRPGQLDDAWFLPDVEAPAERGARRGDVRQDRRDPVVDRRASAIAVQAIERVGIHTHVIAVGALVAGEDRILLGVLCDPRLVGVVGLHDEALECGQYFGQPRRVGGAQEDLRIDNGPGLGARARARARFATLAVVLDVAQLPDARLHAIDLALVRRQLAGRPCHVARSGVVAAVHRRLCDRLRRCARQVVRTAKRGRRGVNVDPVVRQLGERHALALVERIGDELGCRRSELLLERTDLGLEDLDLVMQRREHALGGERLPRSIAGDRAVIGRELGDDAGQRLDASEAG